MIRKLRNATNSPIGESEKWSICCFKSMFSDTGAAIVWNVQSINENYRLICCQSNNCWLQNKEMFVKGLNTANNEFNDYLSNTNCFFYPFIQLNISKVWIVFAWQLKSPLCFMLLLLLQSPSHSVLLSITHPPPVPSLLLVTMMQVDVCVQTQTCARGTGEHVCS